MILVDTSVWVDHLRRADPQMTVLLEATRVLGHPFVFGELALGSVRQRSAFLDVMAMLPLAKIARDEEVLHLIQNNKLAGAGIGYVDAHLLAAVLITQGSTIWTRDKRFKAVAVGLGLAAKFD